MESAIPEHLKCPRLRVRRIADDFVPFYPATVARYASGVKRVVMAYFGVQERAEAQTAGVQQALRRIAQAFGAAQGPRRWDRAHYVDEAGFDNTISIGYWDAPEAYRDWFAHHGSGWTRGDLSDTRVGLFTEVLQPTVERFETLYSADATEGVGGIAEGPSVPIQEHAYWGGMRDRLPLSQTNDLAASGMPRIVTDGLHQTIVPHENVCLSRSGQDWSATEHEERRMYLGDIEPVFRTGMNFLRDDGLAIDCIANRYMTVLDTAGRPTERTFGMSWWKSLAALERWAESHPTHVAIFAAAMNYLGKLGPAAKLQLYHEVTVAAANQQFFEYFNCHPQTGMLRSAGI